MKKVKENERSKIMKTLLKKREMLEELDCLEERLSILRENEAVKEYLDLTIKKKERDRLLANNMYIENIIPGCSHDAYLDLGIKKAGINDLYTFRKFACVDCGKVETFCIAPSMSSDSASLAKFLLQHKIVSSIDGYLNDLTNKDLSAQECLTRLLKRNEK